MSIPKASSIGLSGSGLCFLVIVEFLIDADIPTFSFCYLNLNPYSFIFSLIHYVLLDLNLFSLLSTETVIMDYSI